MSTGANPSVARAGGAAALRWLDHRFDAAFGSQHNPLRQLGAIGFLMLWVLVISGVYLYAVIDTSASGAYPSIDRLSHEAWGLGGLLRSVHRYAADAFVAAMLLHLAREWLVGHAHGVRSFSWWTGVPLLAFGFVCAIGGFWLNWDQLGQYSALATAEWLDALPFFGSPMTRNFLQPGAVSDRLFSLFVFIHLGVPLLLVFGLWFHVQRINRAASFPTRRLALGSVAALIALALAAPVHSHAPADLGVVPGTLALDWLLLFIHPLTEATSAVTVWGLVGAMFVLLVGWPLLPRRAARVPVARVDPANCNGCRRCFDDCPYAAVTMVPHPNQPKQSLGRQLAQVNTDLCASCGICVGACPSSTPFRSSAELVTGIDMPSAPIGALRRRLQEGLAQVSGPDRIVVFGCDRGARVETLAGPDVLPLSLMCIGVLPPSFIEYALRDGASAVLVSGCRAGGCEFRLGQRWTEQRLAGTREPHLRAQVPRERVTTCWADAGDEDELRACLQRLRRARAAATADASTPATVAAP
jgi:quinol-cytochrome oxidoreductase complex cytochrome b subunit/coenzyme F420-reducing hydrogenase delta subunit